MAATGYDASTLAEIIRSVAYVIGALALLAIACGVAWALLHQRRSTMRIESKLGNLDLAVNGVEHTDEDPPLIDKVRRIERTLDRICDHLAIPTHSQKEAA